MDNVCKIDYVDKKKREENTPTRDVQQEKGNKHVENYIIMDLIQLFNILINVYRFTSQSQEREHVCVLS